MPHLNRRLSALLLAALLVVPAAALAEATPTEATPTAAALAEATPAEATPMQATPVEATPAEATPEWPEGALIATTMYPLGTELCTERTPDTQVDALPEGTELNVLELGSCWCRVRTADGREGYVPTIYLLFGTSNQLAFVTVQAGPTAVHRNPFIASETLAVCPPGQIFAVLGEEGSFTRVATPEMTGYVRTERLDVRLAEDMIGARVRVVYPDDPARETTVNLRAEPDLDGRLICQVPTGTEVLWLFDRDEWYIVETDGLRGYMMAQYLEPVE